MKRLLTGMMAVLLLVSCGNIKRQLEDHEMRIARLEEFCKEMNTNISSLQTVVNVIKDYDYVTGVVPVRKGNDVIGYTITFTRSEPITIYHGKKGETGAEGHSPKMGVRQDKDGVYYWTLDGEWLLDDNGRKVKAEGDQGLTPELKVEEGYWFVRYGTGDWTRLGKATGADGKDGDSFFKDVIIKGDQVVFVLMDGVELSIPCQVKGGVAMDPVMLTETTAHFTGKAMELTPDFKVGILYSKTSDVLVKTSELAVTDEVDKDGRFALVLRNLLPDTKYYYRIYAYRNASASYSDVLTFRTSPMSSTEAVDLSAAGTANCYIVPKSGVYKFRTVKGNSMESVGEVASAEVLWESYGTEEKLLPGDLVVQTVTVSDGYLSFMTAENYHEGNAVVAAKDVSGKILWSWHLWLTDEPVALIYANDAGIMMDRNLGAVTPEKGVRGSLGLHYQWGRKDPFPGMGAPSHPDMAYAAYTTVETERTIASDANCGTVKYATEHPLQMIGFNNKNSDWFYTGENKGNDELWASEKTIYDPCPAGWRVPDGGDFGIWAKAGFVPGFKPVDPDQPADPENPPVPEKPEVPGFDPVRLDQTHEGKFFPAAMVGADTWYPAPGGIAPYPKSNGIFDYGLNGYYWSVTPSGSRSFCMSLIREYIDDLQLSAVMPRFDALSVRCCKE